MAKRSRLSAATEDYLEAILSLAGDGGVARVRDIAKSVGVTPSTVSTTLRKLSEKGLVNYEPYQVVTLTSAGSQVAERISRRHELLSSFLRQVLGVSDEAAEADACRLEHGLSPETVDRLVAFMEFLERCPRVGPDWVDHFHKQCRHKLKPESCLACIDEWFPQTRAALTKSGSHDKGGARKATRRVDATGRSR